MGIVLSVCPDDLLDFDEYLWHHPLHRTSLWGGVGLCCCAFYPFGILGLIISLFGLFAGFECIRRIFPCPRQTTFGVLWHSTAFTIEGLNEAWSIILEGDDGRCDNYCGAYVEIAITVFVFVLHTICYCSHRARS